MRHWNEEVKLLIDHIVSQKDYNIDLQKLTVMGFSLGGGTAIDSARKFNEIKYCVALDPYLEPFSEDLVKNKYTLTSIPFLIVSSEF